jgi:hypothetical protein
MRRKLKPPTDDYPAPWEDRPVSRERWRKHRDRMLAAASPGQRPQEWWLYEKGREQPKNQTQILYTMGELRDAELAALTKWWRVHYEDANEVVTVGSFGTLKKTLAQRQAFLDFHNVPHELVEQWDAERVKCNDDAA